MDEALRRLQRRISEAGQVEIPPEVRQYLLALERYANLYESRIGNANIALYVAEPDEFYLELRHHLNNNAWNEEEGDDYASSYFRIGEGEYLIALTREPRSRSTSMEMLRNDGIPRHDGWPFDVGLGFDPTLLQALAEEWTTFLALLDEVRNDGFSYLHLDLTELNMSVRVIQGPPRPPPPPPPPPPHTGPQLTHSDYATMLGHSVIAGAQTPAVVWGLGERLEDELLQRQPCSVPECDDWAINLDHPPIENTNYPLRCDEHIDYCEPCLVPDHPVCGTPDPHGIAGELACPCCATGDGISSRYARYYY